MTANAITPPTTTTTTPPHPGASATAAADSAAAVVSGTPAPARARDTARRAEKARRAAAHPDRPGELCKAPAGTWTPVVDRRRCEGKHDCVDVCPYAVFEVRRMEDAEFRALPLLPKLKVLAHGRKTAYTPNADACQACGLCVVACPEGAITLVRVADR
ncbi:MAG: 4Fe-4S binding protein [Vicinamibacterales bacterium]